LLHERDSDIEEEKEHVIPAVVISVVMNPPIHFVAPAAGSRPSVDEIANHGPLYSSVPYSALARFQHHCALYFQKYLQANQDKDSGAKVDAIALLLQSPRFILSKNLGAASSQSGLSEAAIGWEDDEKQNLSSPDSELGFGEAELTEINATADREASRLCKRAVGLTRSGHLNRAARILCRPVQEAPAARDSAERIQLLKPLHPRAKEDASLVLLPAHSESTTINLHEPQVEKQFRRMIGVMASGASPGLSGWTGDMLKAIYPNSICREGLALLIADICNGALPDEAKEYILPSHLVPVTKPNKSIRPISMGEIFYRAAANFAVRKVTATAAEILGPIQFGVGRGAGCEQAVHRLQHMLTRTSPYPLAGIAVDFKNAFNERSRADILRELYLYPELQSIWRIVDWAYSDPSALWIQDDNQRLFWPKDDLV
jgi:hypothetical protein